MGLSTIRRVCGASVLATMVAGAAACGSAGATKPSSVAGGDFDVVAEQAGCVDQVNAMRVSLGKAPLRRANDLDAFSAEAARVDGEAHDPHLYFRNTNGGHGVSFAQNEIPWWKLSMFGSVSTVIRQGLAQEFAEGPGGGHFDNMTGNYTEIGCGISVSNGEVTVTQDFR